MSEQTDERFVRRRPAKSWAVDEDDIADELGIDDEEHASSCDVFVSNPRSLAIRASQYFGMASDADEVGLPKETVVEFLNNALRIATASIVSVTGTSTYYQLKLYGRNIDFGMNIQADPRMALTGLPSVVADLCVLFDADKEVEVFRAVDWSDLFEYIPAQRADPLSSETVQLPTIYQSIKKIEQFAKHDPEASDYLSHTVVPTLKIYQAVADDDYENYGSACQEAAEQYYDYWRVQDNLTNEGEGLALHALAAMTHGYRTRQWSAFDSEVTSAWLAQGDHTWKPC